MRKLTPQEQAIIRRADKAMGRKGYVRPVPGCRWLWVRRDTLDEVKGMFDHPIIQQVLADAE